MNRKKNTFPVRDIVQGGSFDGYEAARKAVAEIGPPIKTQQRQNNVRKDYNKQRNDNFRARQNKATELELAEELKKKLLPGVKDGMTALDRLECNNTMKCIQLCVTTRAIGFGTVNIFANLYSINNVPVRGTIYSLYRVALATFEAKVQIVNRSLTAITSNNDDFRPMRLAEEIVVAAKTFILVPDQLSSVINHVGKVKKYDTLYYPRIGKDNLSREHLFIPQAEQVCFSNLRQVVVALSDEATPIQYRRDFYNNNPIPGCQWQGVPNEPLLLNPDEIMPDNYERIDLCEEIEELSYKMNFLAKKRPKYFSKVVSFEPDGSVSMLTCNDLGTLRVIDRRVGETVEEYYQRVKLSGDVVGYDNLVVLNANEQLEGSLALLGERPNRPAFRYPPYVNRDERSCIQNSPLEYRSSINMKYA